MFKKQVRKLHLWLGLLSGSIVFILGITGCVYAFIEEVRPIFYHHKYCVESNGLKRKPLTELWAAAQHSLGKDKVIGRFTTGSNPNDTYQFRAFKEKQGGFWAWQNTAYHLTAFVNPYTAEVIEIEDTNLEFFNMVLMLHCNLFLAGNAGKLIAGTSTIIFVILLSTGLVLWWPKNKQAAKKRFWFNWKDATKWKRKNYDLHSIAGFYVMIFAILLAITGLAMTFGWVDKGLQWVANGGVFYEKQKEKPLISSLHTNGATLPVLDQIFTDVRNYYPEAKSYYVYDPGSNPEALINVYIDNGRSYRSVIKQYDRYTANVLKTTRFDDKNNGEMLSAIYYDIHTGNALGIAGKFLMFFASLISASLPVTGFCIWLGKKKHKNSKENTKYNKLTRGSPNPNPRKTD